MRISKSRSVVWANFFTVMLTGLSLTFQLLHGDIRETAPTQSETDNNPESEELAVNPTAFPYATAESQGLSPASLKKLTDIVHGYVKKDEIIGAELLIIKNRHTVVHEVFGWVDREAKKPMQKNTLFKPRSGKRTLK